MITQSKIDEASSDYTEEHYGKRQVDIYIHESFEAGVQFALNEIEPLMVEFADFCSSIEKNRLTGLYWFNFKHITTEQLLAEFIKSKNKQP